MKTENVSTLKIHKLTQAQYDRELAAGNIDENALYLTPDEAITPESIGAAAASHTHAITDVEALDLMLEGFDLELDAKVPTSRKINGKALSSDITLSASDIGAAESGHTHSLKDDTITGRLPASKGGTGNDMTNFRDGVILTKNSISDGTPYVDYYDCLNLAKDYISGILPLSKGGTGISTSMEEAPSNAIIRKATDGDSLYYTATGNGAFYATAENGFPQFGTLPVKQGGTGSTSASKSVTINRGKDIGAGSDAFGYTCKYIPYLNMCFMRVYVQPKEAWSADTEYEVATVGSSTYYPSVMTALSNYAQKEVSAYINTDGQIVVRPYESVGTSYGIRLAGFWFC